jgi:hypothetical protein
LRIRVGCGKPEMHGVNLLHTISGYKDVKQNIILGFEFVIQRNVIAHEAMEDGLELKVKMLRMRVNNSQ